MVKLCFYVPDSHLEQTKQAVFTAGAGRQGNYDSCCFQVRGEGQFRPLEGSSPFIGVTGRLIRQEEWRVELLCPSHKLNGVLAALRQAHPYEEPAIDIFRLEKLD